MKSAAPHVRRDELGPVGGRGWRRPIGREFDDPFRAKRPVEGPLIDDGPVQGLPLGGLGAGSIGRDHAGRFSRWHLVPGEYRYAPSAGSWLAVDVEGGHGPVALTAPGVETRPAGLAPGSGPVGEYEALFPFAWYRFRPEATDGVAVTVREWSPVIPHNIDETSWPVGVFEVTLTGDPDFARDVTVAMAFEVPKAVSELHASEGTAVARLADGPGSFALAVEDGIAGVLRSDADYDAFGRGPWSALDESRGAEPSAQPGLAAAARVHLEPGESRQVVFALAWDLPELWGWYRAHTRRFGRSGDAAPEIARLTLSRRASLASTIEAWHAELAQRLERASAPAWVLAALCNELYVMVEGGTVWLLDESGSEEHFGVLECPDYAFYETLDVRYYSSFVLTELWPHLERVVIHDHVRALAIEDDEIVHATWDGTPYRHQVRDAAPHDLGAPGPGAFRRVNAYDLHDSAPWRDLNPKLVLQVARDAMMLDDDALAIESWPALKRAIHYAEAFDTNGDGLPDHHGRPEQTFDTWPMEGMSAYCTDLWLATLAAGEWLARRAGDEAEAQRLAVRRKAASPVLEEHLWTGTHYRFDSSGGPASEVLMADQLPGTWYALLLGLPEPHPEGRAERALETVLESNFRGFAEGRLGPVNGRSPDGGPADVGSEQAHEVWTGVGWALTSLALLMGRDADAWAVGESIHRTLYEESGLWFRTPEAWTEEREYRACMYQRPLAVWSVLTALKVR